MSINFRISQIIDVKASGSQKDFAQVIKRSPQYVTKLVTEGGSVGLEPVKLILDAYPDIDARWLITGTGEMISLAVLVDMKLSLYDKVSQLLFAESYLPYMNQDELASYRAAVTNLEPPTYDKKQLQRWQELKQAKENDFIIAISKPKTRRTKNDTK